MRLQLTSVERLAAKHQGLQLDVDTLLNQGAPLADIQALLREKYHAEVSHQTLSKYKQKRWLPSVQRIQDRVERTQAIIGVIKKEGASDFARAYIFEQLDEAARRGDRVDPATLLREQRMRMELQFRFQELEQTNGRLQLGIQAVAQKLADATEAAAKKSAGKSIAIEDINSIRMDVFGLPPLDIGTAEPVRRFDPQEAFRKMNEVIGLGQAMEERVESSGKD